MQRGAVPSGWCSNGKELFESWRLDRGTIKSPISGSGQSKINCSSFSSVFAMALVKPVKSRAQCCVVWNHQYN